MIWIVLDSVGMGEAPDAAAFGDVGCNTIGHIMEAFPDLKIPNLRSLGYGNIDGMQGVKPVELPRGSFARLKEASAGKDTTIGHWEMTGIITPKPFPVYPDGFPEKIINRFISETGVPGILYNGVASGTVIINEYGDEHRKTRKPIIYTSADSVFQIACDESIYSPEELYEFCRKARQILTGEHNVARVIARPFVHDGEKYVRTANRRDFSRLPDKNNTLCRLKNAGITVYAVGKIEDIFAGVGISEAVHTKNNEDGMDKTIEALEKISSGLIFTNLVEFDSTWGHRRDVPGYAKGLENFDIRLGELLEKLNDNDRLLITADHGCDPAFKGTDHTREYVPLIAFGGGIKAGENFGTKDSFAFCGELAEEWLAVGE